MIRNWIALATLAVLPLSSLAAGIEPISDAPAGEWESHALVIGVGNYEDGAWSDLPSVPSEVATVAAALRDHGFTVEELLDPTSVELREAILSFLQRHGTETRLVVYYVGHHYNVDSTFERTGYLVPADAPSPNSDPGGFVTKALAASDLSVWSKRSSSTQALFVLDACLYLDVFSTRGVESVLQDVDLEDLLRPVRQFIAGCRWDERTPAQSLMAPSFVRALLGAGDLNKDGYLTGTEIGLYIREDILDEGVTPQYGTILDPRLAGGDFVFYVDASVDTLLARFEAEIGDVLTLDLLEQARAVLRSGESSESALELRDRLALLDGSTERQESLAYVLLKARDSTSASESTRGSHRVLTKKEEVVGTAELGKYKALVIGIDDYSQGLNPLESAVNDATAVGDVLESEYGFEVMRLIDATRGEIVSALSDLRKELLPDSSLLIYYAGHGILDKGQEEGYWLPADAAWDDQTNWLANSYLTNQLKAIRSSRVMVVSDSCFSGALFRDSPLEEHLLTSETLSEWQKRIMDKRSRVAITSGNLEPVTDVGGQGHSIFAEVFLDALRENETFLEGLTLWLSIKDYVVGNAKQTPLYGDIPETRHEQGGDFLFVPTRLRTAE